MSGEDREKRNGFDAVLLLSILFFACIGGLLLYSVYQSIVHPIISRVAFSSEKIELCRLLEDIDSHRTDINVDIDIDPGDHASVYYILLISEETDMFVEEYYDMIDAAIVYASRVDADAGYSVWEELLDDYRSPDGFDCKWITESRYYETDPYFGAEVSEEVAEFMHVYQCIDDAYEHILSAADGLDRFASGERKMGNGTRTIDDIFNDLSEAYELLYKAERYTYYSREAVMEYMTQVDQ